MRTMSIEWRYLGLFPLHSQQDYESLDMLGKAQQGALYNVRNYPYPQWATTFSCNATLKAMTFFHLSLIIPKTFFNLDLIFIDQMNFNETF